MGGDIIACLLGGLWNESCAIAVSCVIHKSPIIMGYTIIAVGGPAIVIGEICRISSNKSQSPCKAQEGA